MNMFSKAERVPVLAEFIKAPTVQTLAVKQTALRKKALPKDARILLDKEIRSGLRFPRKQTSRKNALRSNVRQRQAKEEMPRARLSTGAFLLFAFWANVRLSSQSLRNHEEELAQSSEVPCFPKPLNRKPSKP